MKREENKLSKKNDEKNKKRHDKKLRLKLGTLLTAVFFLIYVPSIINWVYGQNIRTGLINSGTIEDSVNAEAYIVRDEELLISPYDGYAIMEFAEGEKFPANYKLSTIFDESSSNLLEELSQVDKKILQYNSEKVSGTDVFSEDLIKLDKLIEEQVLRIITQTNSNSYSKVTAIRKEIDRLMEKKAEISKSIGKTDAYMDSLLKQREQIKKVIDSHTKEISSEKPGIISYCIDDYEMDFNPSGIKELTPENLKNIKQVESVDFVNSVEVTMNKPFAKIINGIEYYLVLVLERQEIDGFRVDSNVKVRINNIDKLVDGVIDYISAPSGDKFVVSIKIDRFLSDTASSRSVNIDLIKTYYTGYKVPLTSLMRIDPLQMEADIVLVEANHATKQRVKIKGKNEEHAIIDNLEGPGKETDNAYVKLFGIYVINPKNIVEGQVIER